MITLLAVAKHVFVLVCPKSQYMDQLVLSELQEEVERSLREHIYWQIPGVSKDRDAYYTQRCSHAHVTVSFIIIYHKLFKETLIPHLLN